jgi:hypothetical protein
MIVGSFTDRLNQFMSWLFERHWTKWEIITIAVIVVFVLLWIMRRQRKRAVRNVYENPFLEDTPVIGAKLGARERRRRIIKDLKKGRLAIVQKRHIKQQKPLKYTESSEKLHEQIKQLQYEIIKRKETEVRLEEQVAYLTAANEKLQLELAEKKQPEMQTEGAPTAEVQAADEQQKSEVPESKQVEQVPDRQVIEEPAVEKPVEGKPAGKGDKYDANHRVVDGVRQKLCRKCKEWKPESEFHKNASCKDGLAGSCKTCKAKAAKEYRKRRKATKD